ncbi:thioesterase [bacterium]|nr:thioesterase [bacterium]
MPISPGTSADVELVVTEADTAIAAGSGDVPVLATPRLIALCEEATVAAVAGDMPAGMTSVGSRVDFEHLAPTHIGATVNARAVLTRVEGRTLTFSIEATDDQRAIGRGMVVRVAVDRDRFLGN